MLWVCALGCVRSVTVFLKVTALSEVRFSLPNVYVHMFLIPILCLFAVWYQPRLVGCVVKVLYYPGVNPEKLRGLL
jgi:hypothetical protein